MPAAAIDTSRVDRHIHAPGSRHWRAEAEKSGRNRIERLRSLRLSFEAAGVRAYFQLLSDIDHEFRPSAAVAAR